MVGSPVFETLHFLPRWSPSPVTDHISDSTSTERWSEFAVRMTPKTSDTSSFLSHGPHMESQTGIQTGRRPHVHGPKTIKALLLAGLAALLLGHLTAAPVTPAILPRATLHPDPNPNQAFGMSVAIAEDTIVVGEPFVGLFLTGSAYVF